MSTTTFTATYTGDAVDKGSISVRHLAPALLAIGRLVEAANRSANRDHARVETRVQAIERGSFGIVILIDQTILEQARDLVTHEHVETAKMLLQYVFGGGTLAGLYELIKHLKGEPPKSVQRIESPNGDSFQFTNCENVDITVSPTTKYLFNMPSVREDAYEVVRPTESEGIDAVEIKSSDGQVSATLDSDDARSFEAAVSNAPEPPRLSSSTRRLVEIVKPSFDRDLMWRLRSDSEKFRATIADDAFLKEVDRGERFGKGDVLEVELETRTWHTPRGLSNRYVVTKVYGLVHPEETLAMFPDPEETGEAPDEPPAAD